MKNKVTKKRDKQKDPFFKHARIKGIDKTKNYTILAMHKNYEKLIKAGNKAQLEKLRANSHKKGLDDIEIKYALDRIKEKTKELQIAIAYYNSEVMREKAADVANFAHMIILKCDKLMELKHEKRIGKAE